MGRPVLLLFFVLGFGANILAHQPFTLVSSEKKIIKFDDLVRIEKERTPGKKEGTTLVFTEKEIRLVIVTGPEDDMLSYRILGMRSPTLVMPAGATLRILFVNKDIDMRHDVRFGHVAGEFPLAPGIALSPGSTRLDHKSDDDTMQAEEIVIKANDDGVYKYFCSVRGHAKGGMWGNIAVGVKPGDLKTPEKAPHVHSPDEDKDIPVAPKKPGDKKPHDMATMPETDQKAGEQVVSTGQPGLPVHPAPSMRSITNIGDPMARESSGTAWAPDSSPVYGHMKMYDDGAMLMLMGTVFVRYTDVGSQRDVSVAGKGSRSRADAPSMFMAMYSRPLNERSQVGLRAMVSLDPIIQRGWGYPLLYQSGELYGGQPIHDRQHPHDLFSELAATYSYKFDAKRSFFLYAGIPGRTRPRSTGLCAPALGRKQPRRPHLAPLAGRDTYNMGRGDGRVFLWRGQDRGERV